MGLTILAFISIPGFVALFLLAVRRGAGMPGRGIIAVIAAILAVYSLAQGTVFVLTGPGFQQSYALFIERMSGSLIVLTHFLILLLAINFPTPPPVWVRWLSRAVILPIALAAAWDAAFSFDYIFSVYRPWTTIFRSEGRYYNLFVFGDAAIAASPKTKRL